MPILLRHTVLPLAALAALAAGCGGKPPPLPAFDIVVYGDSRHQSDVHRRVAARIAQTAPACVLSTGDLVDHPDEGPLWAEFRDAVKEIRARTVFCSAPGDHDLGPGRLFLKEMGTERLYYDRRAGDVHVFILDSSSQFRDADQVAWLEKTASASDAPHKLAVFHRPPFTIDPKRLADAEQIRPQIHGLLVKLRFCAAFNGHTHAFYATVRDGVRYVITAGGGAPLRTVDPTLGLPGDLSRTFYHFIGLHVDPKRIRARVFDSGGVEAADLAFTVCEHP